MRILKRLLDFIASRMLIITVVCALLIISFYLAMNTANIWVLIDDGLHALAQLKGEAVAVREMRRHIVCYVRGMRDAARLRVKVNAITEIDEMEAALTAFMLEGKA